MEASYILTAEMDGESFAWLDGLRRQHFPAERNVLPAHLTLFHRLSAAQVSRLQSIKMPCASVELCFERISFLGFGVAFQVRSAGLERLRSELRTFMGGEFSRQDTQPWKPHVTVQNKVSAKSARELHGLLIGEFAERAGVSTGLLIWEYLGGPWKFIERLAFVKQ